MTTPNLSAIRHQVERTVGPAPWYWRTFPAFISPAGQRFVWTHQGSEGSVAYVISLALEQEPDKPRLALNTYCRPFLASSNCLGIWCPEGRSIRLAGFDPDQLKSFDLAEIAGWFKQSSDRIYSKTSPLAEIEIPLSLGSGMHKIEVPPEFATVDELIVPTSYKAMSNENGSPHRNIRLATSGCHAPLVIQSRIESTGNASGSAHSCWKKTAAASRSGSRKSPKS
jgi:hypothetical protein